MGGGRKKPKPKKNPTAGGPTQNTSGRRPRPQPIIFKHESRGEGGSSNAPRGAYAGNTIGYIYPSTPDPAGIGLAEAAEEEEVEVPTYSYHPACSEDVGLGFQREEGDEFGSAAAVEGGHLGLGFVEMEVEEEVMGEDQAGEKEVEEGLSTPEVKEGSRSEGFLSIGGYRVYTEDTSSPEEDMGDDDVSDDDEDEDGDEVKPSGGDEELYVDDEEEDEEEDEDSDSESDDSSEIDDEIVQDYMEGIGGADEFLSGLSKNKLKELECESDSGNSESEPASESDEDGFSKKLGGVKLMEASEVYGMKEKKWKGKGKASVADSSARIGMLTLDNVVGLKDCRSVSRRKKSAPSQLSTSWPGPDGGRRSKKNYRNAPGEKKKHRKELIAEKRRHRMLDRGVDLDQINNQLRQMVLDKVDMYAFQPMHSQDCSQVQRLASIYRFKSGCQGSGKKRFVMVARTSETSMPSAVDQIRLDKLLGVNLDDGDFAVVDVNNKKTPRGARKASFTERPKNSKSSGRKSTTGKATKTSFAEKPVAFVSSGTMLGDLVTKKVVMETIVDSTETTVMVEKVGAFEMHTTGFGSKMMAKMGFIEGSGLGKDGQGMVRPIEPVQRPKSLGLGVEFESGQVSDTKAEKSTPKAVNSSLKVHYSKRIPGIGGFEKHTKGFGSKMMERMGFTPGSGLGKNGQGIIDPLRAVRRPKSLGLGAWD